MSNPPDPDMPNLQELLRSLPPQQREDLSAWLDAREQALQSALAEIARGFSAVSALLAEAVALRNDR